MNNVIFGKISGSPDLTPLAFDSIVQSDSTIWWNYYETDFLEWMTAFVSHDLHSLIKPEVETIIRDMLLVDLLDYRSSKDEVTLFSALFES